jgi:hypothetical protein
MANYIIQGKTLKAIADEVRELTDVTDELNPNEMITNMEQANADVAAQTEIIEQIRTALDGKAGSGGLPDWDDDSPVVCSGTCYANKNAHWEITEKGTFSVVGSGGGYICNSSNLNVAMSMVPQIIPFLDKVKQVYISDGITSAEFWFMINCERVRLADSLTTKPSMTSLPKVKELDMSADIYKTLNDYRCSAMYSLEKVTLSPLTTIIPQACFQNSYSLKEIALENITEFKNLCFSSCFNLTKPIVVNSGLVRIRDQAFQNTSIPSITFQNSLDSLPTISSNAFAGCIFLKDIYVPWAEGAVANAPWGATNATIHYNSEV